MRDQWIGALALFLVLTTGTAWALGANTVGTKQIKPSGVQSSDIAVDAVASEQIAGSSILGGDIFNGTIGTNDIGDGEVIGADIASETIGTNDIGNGGVNGADIADGGVTGADIADNTIFGGHIVNGTVGTNDIGDREVRGVDIESDFNHAYTANGSEFGSEPLSVSVPAGKYVVVAQATLYNSDNDTQQAVCSLQGQEMYHTSVGGFLQDTVPINATATLASPGNITIACGGFRIRMYSPRLTVIRVNGIN